jgi:hypothetical protein
MSATRTGLTAGTSAARVERAQVQREAARLVAPLVWKDENVRYLTDLRAQLIAGKTTALNEALLVEGAARSAPRPGLRPGP